MVRNAAWRRSLLCVLALSLSFASSPCNARIYTNHWAVRIAGGPDVAEWIADKYGYRNMGQIGDLKDHYHFFHSRTIKRSTLSSRGRHSFISMEPKAFLPLLAADFLKLKALTHQADGPPSVNVGRLVTVTPVPLICPK
ncbi:proprotein convertase subtilisin/kexin type 5-like [Plectropomus leopardus]|uniref:proprotein convertase subtilisin/kexin type 5-like n=1 Tax=Plectropomus leopardus TaxID=160734 RepID=UPI001C4BA1C5|nr:proprotein convertase subtilisin/kexin type 5-like [Plectropomus leopardus]XP_042338368.1 proprotein convertase subtilisin/kexin type 5-like [Plectropomus leopardus]